MLFNSPSNIEYGQKLEIVIKVQSLWNRECFKSGLINIRKFLTLVQISKKGGKSLCWALLLKVREIRYLFIGDLSQSEILSEIMPPSGINYLTYIVTWSIIVLTWAPSPKVITGMCEVIYWYDSDCQYTFRKRNNDFRTANCWVVKLIKQF